jgi:hypothetical protein
MCYPLAGLGSTLTLDSDQLFAIDRWVREEDGSNTLIFGQLGGGRALVTS